MLHFMISSASLSAFSSAPVTAAQRPQPAPTLAALTRQPSAAPAALGTATTSPQPPQPGQRLPRGSLVNLSV